MYKLNNKYSLIYLYFFTNLLCQIYILCFIDLSLFTSLDIISYMNPQENNTPSNVLGILDTSVSNSSVNNSHQNFLGNYFAQFNIDWTRKDISYINFDVIGTNHVDMYISPFYGPGLGMEKLENTLGTHFFWSRSGLNMSSTEYCNLWQTNFGFRGQQILSFQKDIREVVGYHNGDSNKALSDVILTLKNNTKGDLFFNGVKCKGQV